MKRLTSAICTLLLFALTSYATSPTTTNASLKGTYVFLMARSANNSWGQNLNCGGSYVFMGGSETRVDAVIGTMAFDGLGGVTGSYTEYGGFDSTSSNNTVSCTSNGNAVYFGPESGTLSGSYSVAANGTGTATITPSGSGDTVNIQMSLVGNCASTGVNDAILLSSLRPDNSVENIGSARLQ